MTKSSPGHRRHYFSLSLSSIGLRDGRAAPMAGDPAAWLQTARVALQQALQGEPPEEEPAAEGATRSCRPCARRATSEDRCNRLTQRWQRVTSRLLRLSFKRREFALLGSHLRQIKERGKSA